MDFSELQANKIAQSLMSAFASVDGGTQDTAEAKKKKVAMLEAIASTDTEDGNKARKAYCESRAEVLLPLIAAQSTVRSIFTPEVLGPLGQSSYPINFDYTEVATSLPKMASVVSRLVEGDEIYIPTFGIQAAIRYNIDIARQGRLDIEASATRELGSRITAQEELAGWNTIKQTLALVNSAQTVYASGTTVNFPAFTKQAVNKLQLQIETQRRELNHIYASPRSIADIREWTTTQIDYLTQREIFVNGGLPGGKVWDITLHKVYDSSLVANTEAWGFDNRTFGKMPIKQELETKEDPMAVLNWQIGTIARELVGFGVTDSFAFAKLVLPTNHLTSVVPASY